MIDSEVLESNRLFIQAWELWASRSRAGEISRLPGLAAPWWNVTWPMCNLTFFSEPVRDEAELDSRTQAALEHARERGLGWLLFVCEDLLPENRTSSAQDAFARHGLALIATVTGMSAGRLLPPRRPLPDLEFRRVEDPETRRAFGEINALAYGIPADWAREALDVEALWGEGTFGFVGYLDGEAVTTAKTIAMDGVLYMALVATRPEHQKRGYAEAAMRHSLAKAQEATGLERTVLHASPEGFPLYQEMGYRAVTRFHGLIGAEGGAHG